MRPLVPSLAVTREEPEQLAALADEDVSPQSKQQDKGTMTDPCWVHETLRDEKQEILGADMASTRRQLWQDSLADCRVGCP